MSDFHNIKLSFCEREVGKKICEQKHYMKTYPQGAKVNIIMTEKNQPIGICVFGYSTATNAKINKYVYGLKKEEYLEMQRLWISDNYGKNTESYILSKIIKILKEKYKIKIIVTHSGGCKDDCGIVYQSSGWLYFGSQKCDDFYLTNKGEYKNMVAAMRFGRVQIKNKTKQEIGEELFGEGRVINSNRYLYLYPLDKSIRRRLNKIALPFPKTSKVFRKDQKWVKQGASVGTECESVAGSTPASSKE